MDQKSAGLNIAIFFCQRTDPNQDVNRRRLEKVYGSQVKFFPLPCGGRIDPLHMMKALEAGADMVYLVTCPVGTCRYREGNTRAAKRVAYAQGLIEEIGLERARFELINTQTAGTTIDAIAEGLLMSEALVGPSPLRDKK